MALVSSGGDGGSGGEAMLCRITQSQWKEGEMVPTYFVSQKPRKGHFQRLKDALQQAPMYSRIEIVGGGTFREKIVIDKPLEIGVAKAAEMPTIVNKGTGVVCQVDEALLEGIRIEAEDSTTPCVTIVRGSPKLRWCVLQAVEVSGTASPTIEECKILDSKTHGLFLTDRAGGTYTKNSIWGHAGFSVQIESHAEPTVSYNVIAGSELGQVRIQDDPEDPGRVSPYFLLNRISDERDVSRDMSGGPSSSPGGGGPSDAFAKSGAVSMSNAANEHGVLPAHKLDALPVKRVGMKVAILPSQNLNVHSADFDEETSDDSVLMDNVTTQHCAVLITGSHAQPTFVRNTISSCKQHGMMLKGGAGGVYETNYFSANKGWGIIIQGETTAPVFTANHVSSNGGGVRVLGSPAHFVHGNSFLGNRGPQLVLHDGHPRFLCEDNTIKSGNRTGALCTGAGTGTFRRNHFESCAIAVRVESMADPVLDHDVFEQCRIGVYVRDGGLGQFVSCHITDIILYGALVMSHGNPIFQGCQFVFNETGAVVMRRGKGTFEGCCFRDCRECGMDVSTDSHPVVSRCEVRACLRGGVRVHGNGRGVFTQNLFARNQEVQLLVADGGDPVVSANVIGFAEADGVLVENGGLGTFDRNVIQSCFLCGVVVVGPTSAPVVRANQIADCGLSGLHLTDGRLGTYEKNIITRCCRACVSVEGYAIDSAEQRKASTEQNTTSPSPSTASIATPVVLRSNFFYSTSCCGVIAERRATLLVHKCVFRDHQQGLLSRGGSDVVLIDNTFRDCTHGVCADDESALQLCLNTFCTIRGTAVASLSTCLFQARGNVFAHCGTALLLRRIARGICLENTISQSALYGILLGTDCRCVVTRNILNDDRVGISFAELHNRADVLDNCVVRALEQGIRVSGDAMDTARCRQNVVLSAKVGVFVRLGCLKLECNLLLNCETGVHINAVPGKSAGAAAAAAGVAGGALSSTNGGDSTLSGPWTAAKRAAGHKLLAPHQTQSAHQELTQSGGGPSAQLQYCYVSCCSRGGVAATGGGSVVSIAHTLFSNNDIGFHIDGARASLTVMRGCVISNSAAAGVYAQACPGTPCLVEDSVLFKNFLNVVCVDGAAPELRRCVLQAPVVFNVFVSGVRASPRFIHCLICPRATAISAAAATEATTTVRKGNLKDGAASKLNGLIPSATVSFAANSTGAPTQPIETLLRSAIHAYATVVDFSQTHPQGLGGGASLSRRQPLPRESSASQASVGPTLEVAADKARSWLVTPSLWADHYTEPPAWQREAERDLEVERVTEQLKTPHGQLRARLVQRRRSAILWPANVQDEGVLGGPGGPFIVHRMRVRGDVSTGLAQSSPSPQRRRGEDGDDDGGDDSHTMSIVAHQRHRAVDVQYRNDYLYSCSGLWLEHASTPVLEGCYIGEHVSIGTGFDRPVALPEEHSWALRFLPYLGEVRSGAAAASVSRLRASDVLAPLTASYVPPLASVSTDTLLGQLLLVGSPCFWRQRAVSPLYFHEQCPLLAEAMTEPVTQLVRKRQFESFTTSSIHFGAAFTAHLVGTGVFARHYAEGEFQSCTLARNTCACRLSMGAKTSFKNCQLTANTAEAVVLEGRCVASLQNCTFRDGRHTQILILGVETAPVIKQNAFFGSTFTAIVVSQGASPRLTANQFTSVQSAAVVVETGAEPFLERNTFDACQCGVEYRSGAKGRLEHNQFKSSTLSAVVVKDSGTTPALVSNTFVDTRKAALQVIGYGAQPYVEENTLTANDTGFWLRGGAQGTYLHNTLRRHRQGVLIEDSQGYFRGNNIAESHFEGVLARGTQAAPVVLLNRIQDGDSVGLRWDGAQGQIARNRLLHNAEHGCVIEGASASPSLVGNEIAFNGGIGLRVGGGSAPVFHCNLVTSNGSGGVCIVDGDTHPQFEGDYIKANSMYGVLFDKKARGSLSACVVSATVDGPAVAIHDGARPVLQETAIISNTAGGVVVQSGAVLEASRCLFAHNRCKQSSSSASLTTAALVVASSEDGCVVAGCMFVENDVSFLAQRGARVELTACGFLGVHASNTAAVRVQTEASPLFTHCLFASTRWALSEEGTGRYTRCQFIECATGADVSGPSTFYECEFLECGTGLRVAAGAATVMGCIMASCTKVGLHLTGDARPSVGECGLLRNVRGVLADGGAAGIVSKSRILWNTDNVVFNDQATTTVEANLIYDSANSGVLVRGGAPTISNNDIFDNHYAGVAIESASGGLLEENRVSFAREDGALVVRNEKESLVIAANTLRNSSSPPANSQFRNANERQLGYRRLGMEKEKDSVTLAALRSFLEEVSCLAALRLTTLLTHTVGAATNKEWLVMDGESTSSVAPAGGAAEATTSTAAGAAPSSGRRTTTVNNESAPAAPGQGASGDAVAGDAAGVRDLVEEPVTKFFEPLHARWEKLNPDAAAAARRIAFVHTCSVSAAMGTSWSESASSAVFESSPDTSTAFSQRTSLSMSASASIGAGQAAASTRITSSGLPPIADIGSARRATKEGSPTHGGGRRRSHVDAADAKAMSPLTPASPSAVPRRPAANVHRSDAHTTGGRRPTVRGTEGRSHEAVEELLPPAVALVTLFHVKRALLKQLEQLQGTPNATPAHVYTTVLHRQPLQTVNTVLDSDAFRAVFELRRSQAASAVRKQPAAAKGTRSAAGDKRDASNRIPKPPPPASSGQTTTNTRRKTSSFVGTSDDGATAMRLPSISGARGTRKSSAASPTSASLSSPRQRGKRDKRKNSSTLLGDATAGKPRKKKKKTAA